MRSFASSGVSFLGLNGLALDPDFRALVAAAFFRRDEVAIAERFLRAAV